MGVPSIGAPTPTGGGPGLPGEPGAGIDGAPGAAGVVVDGAAGPSPAAASPEDPAAAHHAGLQIGALLVAAALLRMGVVAGTDAVIFDLNSIYDDKPPSIAVGFVGASQAVAEMVLAFVLARQADRIGRTRFLVGGPLLGAAGILLVALANHPVQFAAARLLEGIGAAAFVPTALGMVAASTARNPRVRAKASGAFEGATLVGYAGGFVLGSQAWHLMHRWSFVVFAGFYLLAALICATLVDKVPPLPVSPLSTVTTAILGPGPIRIFIPAWLAVNCLVGAWYVNMTSLLKHAPEGGQTLVGGFDERLIGLMKLSFVLLLILGIVLWTPYLQRHGGPATMRRAVPGAFLVCASLALVNHTPLGFAPLLLPLAVVGILCMAGFVPAAVNYLSDCSEVLVSDRSALMAFYTVTLAGGSASGAVLGGVAGKLLLFDGLLVLGVGLAMVAIVSLNAVRRYEAANGPVRDHVLIRREDAAGPSR